MKRKSKHEVAGEKPEEPSKPGRFLPGRLQEQLHFIQNVMEFIPIPIFFKDRKGVYTGCNRAFEEYVGLDRSRIVGKTAYDISPHDLAERYEQIDEALFADPGVKSYEGRMKHADGTLHDVIFNKATFNNLEGETAGLVAAILDITEQKRAEEELMREADAKAAVAELSSLLLSSASIEEISDSVLENARRLTGSKLGLVGYIDAATGNFTAVSMIRGTREGGETRERNLAINHRVGMWGDVIENNQPVLENRVNGGPDTTGIPSWHEPIRNFLAAPAMHHEILVGQIALANADRDYSEVDLALVESLADHYALAVQGMFADEALVRSKEFAENVIETAEAMVVMRDRQGNVWMFNRAAEEVTGYTRDEIIGSNWFEQVSPRERYPDAWSKFEEFREGKSLEREPFATPILNKSGEERFISWRSSEVREHGQVAGLISIGLDITDRRQAEEDLRESEEKYRTLFDTSTDSIFITSLEGVIIDCNPQAVEMAGYTHEEFIGRPFEGFIKAEALQAQPKLLEQILASGEVPIETTGRSKVGIDVEIEISANVITLKDQPVVIGYVRDITERKEREKRMAEMNRDLQAFASTLSHDLRSPLGSALGYAATLRRIYSGQLDETGREGLDVMVTSLERMNDLIEGILSYTRAGSVGERDEEMVMGLMMEGIAEELRENGTLSGVDFSIEGELPVVTGDSLRLYQVIVNLIGNAAKFSSGRPAPAIEVGHLHRGDQSIIYVKDNGPGISPGQLSKIFEPLARTDDARGIPGHGLGLAIVKRAVESWGGRVWAESEYGRGATFFFTLP
jgi:PAS domain S-box-containing protein